MNRLIIVGSPRVDGRSAHLANMLFETCIEECPDDELALAPVSTLDVAGCQGCDACRQRAERLSSGGNSGDATDDAQEGELALPCAIDDDMQELYELIDAADELTVVSPVYFSGPPSQLKALFDRLQPYFWTRERQGNKRPCTLHVVGEGGDPHGYDALVGCVRSAVAVAGFSLSTVFDWVGKIDEAGEIVADAEEISLADAGAREGASGGSGAENAAPSQVKADSDGACENEDPCETQPGSSWGERGGARRRLSLDDAQATPSKGASRGGDSNSHTTGAKGGSKSKKQQPHRGAGAKKPPRKSSGSRSGSKGSKGGNRRG